MKKFLSWPTDIGLKPFAVIYWMALAGHCYGADLWPNPIPLSPQMTEPNDGWIAYLPFVILAGIALLYFGVCKWWIVRHSHH